MKRYLLPVFFVITLFAVGGHAQEERRDGRVFWRGSVDDKVQLVITGVTLEEKTVSGRPQSVGGYSFTAPLPKLPVTVTASRVEGRGKVTVLQQPLEANNFTAIIEIHDDRGGANDYLLNISWQ